LARLEWSSLLKVALTVSFPKHILQQELWSGKMCFTSWRDFTKEFVLMFCLENEATTALMRLKSDDNPNTTQTMEYTKDKYNVKIRK
jgi:hypothetical protein